MFGPADEKELTKEQYRQYLKETLHRIEILKNQRNEVLQQRDGLLTNINDLIEHDEYNQAFEVMRDITELKKLRNKIEGVVNNG